MPWSFSRLPVAALALLALLQTGCSAARLAYGQADWLLEREIGKAFCPGPVQREWLEPRVDELHSWHRYQELPRYARVLRRLAAALERPVTRALVDETFETLQLARDRLARRMTDPAVAFLERLGQRQVLCLARYLARRWEETQRDLRLPEARLREKRREQIEDSLDDWVGDLTASQRGTLDRFFAGGMRTARVAATARYNAGQRLLALLGERGDPSSRRQRLRQVIQDRFALFDERETRAIRSQERTARDRVWAMARLLTAEQRERLKKRLLSFAEDCEALARL